MKSNIKSNMNRVIKLYFISLVAFALSVSAYAVDKGSIVGYWPANEGSGNKVIDVVGGANGVTKKGPGWKGDPHTNGWGEGKFGKGLAFNEKEDWFVEVKTNDKLDRLGKPNTSFTVAYWIRSTKTLGKGRTVDKGSSGWTQGWHAALVGGKAFFELCDDKAPGVQIPGTKTVADDTWHHLAHVIEAGKEERTYVDGALDAKKDIASDPDIAGVKWDLTFGSVGVKENPWHEFLTGTMDEIVIFNKSLSEAEIKEVMAAPVIAPGVGVEVKNNLLTTWSEIKNRY